MGGAQALSLAVLDALSYQSPVWHWKLLSCLYPLQHSLWAAFVIMAVFRTFSLNNPLSESCR